MPKLTEKLDQLVKKRSEPLWKGPMVDDPMGGITQSMLQKFLICRERFRIQYVLGLQSADDFRLGLEYGNMWHACEESHARCDPDPWHLLNLVTLDLCKRYPYKQDTVLHWHEICKLQFPIYIAWWEDHPDELARQPMFQEKVFSVPYILPDGRKVFLRGKWDQVDSINGDIWLKENKSKGELNQDAIARQLSCDLQSMIYLIALRYHLQQPIAGIRYNVIRRPLSGGKGTIKQKKGQTLNEFYEELKGKMEEATGPEWGVEHDEHFFFARWDVPVSDEEITIFRYSVLDPILTQLCDWWEWLAVDIDDPFRGGNTVHWRTPYGLYSPLYGAKGGSQDMEHYLNTGSTVGLHRAETLFRELQ